jgi:hypothetical protein
MSFHHNVFSAVIPAKSGIHGLFMPPKLDSRFRGNDGDMQYTPSLYPLT